jgi:hypothetical protein
MPWNTTCKLIRNSAPDPFYVIDNEEGAIDVIIDRTGTPLARRAI